jgi:hypothetical protein
MLGALLVPAGSTAECVSGTSVAVPTPGDPLGDWKYCVTASWDLGGYALSYLDVVLGLGECPCVCESFPFGAADTAGTSSAETSAMGPVTYRALFECKDDRSLPENDGPRVRFEHGQGGPEPGVSGSGAFCFYSDWPPVPASSSDARLVVKHGRQRCEGELIGDLPGCSCLATSTRSTTWGRTKAIFR